MKKAWMTCWLVCTVVFGLHLDAGAESSFRCGTQLVDIGDSRSEVVGKCGEPSMIDAWEEERLQRDFGAADDDPRTGRTGWTRQPFLVKVHVTVELWTYNSGPTRFLRYLRFENGVLREITTGPRGY